jgi:pimeloyl-ACP methyl ester carboxylesterase
MSSQFERYPTPALADYEASPKDETIGDFYDTKRTRRNFMVIGAAASSLLVLGLETDTQLAKEHYRSHDLAIEMVKQSIDTEHAHHATIFIPPFNFLSAEPFAAAVQDTVAQYGSVAALTHDGEGFSVDDCEVKIREFIETNDLKTLTLAGSSVGGLIATVLATRIPEVNHLTIDSGPANVGNIKDLPDFLPVKLSAALDKMEMTGGPILRTGFEFAKRMSDGDKSLQQCLAEATAGMRPNECPNGVDIDLFLFLWTHDALTQKERLTHPIDIDYLGASKPARDTLVDQTAAAADYQELAQSIGGNFSMHTSVETGHSDIPHHAQAFGRMFDDAFMLRETRLELQKLGNRPKRFSKY